MSSTQNASALAKRSVSVQLVLGAVLGSGQALLSEPRRSWRFLVLAAAAVVAVALYERLRKDHPPGVLRQSLVVPMALTAASWGIAGFAFTELRLWLR